MKKKQSRRVFIIWTAIQFCLNFPGSDLPLLTKKPPGTSSNASLPLRIYFFSISCLFSIASLRNRYWNSLMKTMTGQKPRSTCHRILTLPWRVLGMLLPRTWHALDTHERYGPVLCNPAKRIAIAIATQRLLFPRKGLVLRVSLYSLMGSS